MSAPTHHARCGGTLLELGDALMCAACRAETHRRCHDNAECGMGFLPVEDLHVAPGGDVYCTACRDADLEYASAITRLVAPDVDEMVRFGNAFVDGETPDWLTALFPDGNVTRHYHRTDGWRGFYDTPTIMVGVASIASGWVTGDYDDVAYKADTHRLADVLNQHKPPVPFMVITEPTSNVFSTAAEILVAEADLAAAWEYLGMYHFTPEGLQAAFH